MTTTDTNNLFTRIDKLNAATSSFDRIIGLLNKTTEAIVINTIMKNKLEVCFSCVSTLIYPQTNLLS